MPWQVRKAKLFTNTAHCCFHGNRGQLLSAQRALPVDFSSELCVMLPNVWLLCFLFQAIVSYVEY